MHVFIFNSVVRFWIDKTTSWSTCKIGFVVYMYVLVHGVHIRFTLWCACTEGLNVICFVHVKVCKCKSLFTLISVIGPF